MRKTEGERVHLRRSRPSGKVDEILRKNPSVVAVGLANRDEPWFESALFKEFQIKKLKREQIFLLERRYKDMKKCMQEKKRKKAAVSKCKKHKADEVE